MLLAIDVGNTQTHVGMFRGGGLVEHWRFATVREATGDELATVLASLLSLRGLALGNIDGAIVSSVVPQLIHEYEHLARRYVDAPFLIVGPGIRTGIPIRTEHPHEVGADRLVNAVAAYDRVGAACIVVDFGTAITYDVVSARGELLGAIITPGVEISMEALSERAAKLPKVELERPKQLIGRSTPASIQSGVIYGFAGQVDGILGRLHEELGDEVTSIATGGLASSIAPFCDRIDEIDDLLTLTGLRLVWERNRS